MTNEFGALTPDELHFLRVFIYCEGGIRDMEAALGVSYPTVKGHLASIKEKLNLAGKEPARRETGSDVPATGAPASGVPTSGAPASGVPTSGAPAGAASAEEADAAANDVLDKLESGKLDAGEAVRLLKSRRKGGASR